MSIIQKNMNENSRIVWIDVLKTLAIFLVIVYHDPIYSIDVLSETETVKMYSLYFMRTILSTGVPIFFFVNGFLLLNKEFNLKKHIFKTIRMTLLAIVWGIICLLLLMVIRNDHLSFPDFIKGLWNWKTGWINHLWYLGALVCIYIFFPLLKQVYDTNKKIFIYFTIICFLMTFGNTVLNEITTIFSDFILHRTIMIQGFNFFNIFNPFQGIYTYSFVYFCIGGLTFNILGKINAIPNKVKNSISILGLTISSFCLWGIGMKFSIISETTWDVVWNGYDTIFTLLNVYFIFILCLSFKKNNYFFSKVSSNTLGIYFIHLLIIEITKPYIIDNPSLCNFPINLFFSFLVLCISLLISILLKRIPLLKKFI